MEFPNKKFDIILVDTIHTYEQVKAECQMIEHLLKPKTIILFHDTKFKPEIIPAIIEFTNKHNKVIFLHETNNGLWEVHLNDQI